MKLKRLIAYVVCVLIGILRIYVVSNAVEPHTGFYIRGSVLSNVYIAVVIASVAGILILALTSRNTSYDTHLLRGGFVSCVSYILTGAAMLASAFFYYLQYNDLSSKYSLLLILAGVAGGICTILMGIYHTTNVENPSVSLLMIGTIAWFAVSLIGTFKNYTTIITISSNLQTALTMTVTLLFIFYASKSYVDIKLYSKLQFTGLCSFLGAMITAVPDIWFWLNGKEVFTPSFTPDIIVLATMVIFIPTTLSMIDRGVKNEKQ